jgi:membrane-associated protease RseP (regulator of RpoE activity)
MDLLAILGFLAFLVGLMLSIALHEVGHLVGAKLLNVKATQYMVGFGNTVWSTRRGETEYGIKSIPLGGYVRMVGMFPPAGDDDGSTLRASSTGPFQAMIEDARAAAREEVKAEDVERLFYRKPWYKKLAVMAAGPGMNIVVAFGLFAIVLMGFGASLPTTTISQVNECIIALDDDLSVDEQRTTCEPDDPPSPAAEAGLLPGDTIQSFDGQSTQDWDDLTAVIREAGGETVEVVVDRGGETVTLAVDVATTFRYADPEDPCNSDLVSVGFLGVSPVFEEQRLGVTDVVAQMSDFTARTVDAVLSIPQRMVGIWQAAFGSGERDVCSPVGIVGAGRIGGEIASSDSVGVADRFAGFLGLLASFNLAIAVFNFIPLLPLDGGHMAGAIWEGIKRGFARLTGRPEPAPVDVTKGLPIAYGVAILLVVMSLLVLYADIVNPVRLPG